MASITDTKDLKPRRIQNPEREKVRVIASERIERLRGIHNRTYPYLRNRTVTKYVEDSVKRFNEYKERPAYKQQWQSNLAGTTIRDKSIGILSKLASQAMEAKVLSTNELSYVAMKKERVSQALLKGASIKNNDDFELVYEMLEAETKGTIVGFESWKYGERKVKDVIAYDIDGSIKVKERILKEWNDVWGMLIPLEDVFWGYMFVNHIQKMDEVAWRQVVKWDQFQREFDMFEDVKLVLPKGSITGSQPNDTIFRVSSDLAADEVEIFRYFNKATDEYLMIANDVWINPMGKNGIQPLIWNHKKLPLWSAQFEPIASNFILGKSLPDKMMANADYEDKFLDNVLDRLTIALNAPLVAPEGTTSLTETYLQPQNIIQYPQGSTPPTTLEVKEPSQASFNILELLQRRLESSSISAEASGGGGSLGSKTATQVSIERAAALELVSLFLKLMEFGIRDKNRLRLANIFQFYTLPIHRDSKELKFKQVILRNEPLTNGRVGSLQVSIVGKVDQNTLNQESQMLEDDVEKIEITPSFIRDFEADLQIVPSSSVKASKELQQAMELNFQRVMASLYPDKFNRDAGFEDLLTKFDKNPSKYTVQAPEKTPAIPGMPETPGMQGAPAEPVPMTQTAEPTLRQLIG